MKTKSHKIPGVPLSECNAEMKIAYNYLFSWLGIRGKADDKDYFEHRKDCALSAVDRNEKLKKYNVELIKSYISDNAYRYVKSPFIAWSYEDIGDFFGTQCC